MLTKLLAIIFPVIVLAPADSITVPVAFDRRDDGHLVSFSLTLFPSTSRTDGYRFLVHGECLSLRTYYRDSYDDVRLGLAVRRGTYVLARRDGRDPVRWRSLRFERGRSYWIVAFWRRVGTSLELGIYRDGELVSWDLVPEDGPRCELWPSRVRIGARDTAPSAPEHHWIEGRIDALEVFALRGGAVQRAR